MKVQNNKTFGKKKLKKRKQKFPSHLEYEQKYCFAIDVTERY